MFESYGPPFGHLDAVRRKHAGRLELLKRLREVKHALYAIAYREETVGSGDEMTGCCRGSW